MKILITSGGTKVPIDPVRDITNKSNGTFGSKIAKSALENGFEVHFLTSKSGVTPFKMSLDAYGDYDCINSAYAIINFYESHKDQYVEFQYITFDEYKDQLNILLNENEYDAVILVAAVSDYLTEAKTEKVKSDSNMEIKLHHAPKLIGAVREKQKNAVFVGFKLLVDVPEQALIDASFKSIEANDCDFIVANDYAKLKSGNHEIILVHKDGRTEKITDQYSSNQHAIIKNIIEYKKEK